MQTPGAVMARGDRALPATITPRSGPRQRRRAAQRGSAAFHQPMGFWSPAVLVGDAKRHGVRGREPEHDSLHARRRGDPDWARTGSRTVIERLILAGALNGFGVPCRTLLWELGGLRTSAGELDLAVPLPPLDLATLTPWELRRQEEQVLGLSVGDHAFGALRSWLARQGLASSRALRRVADGSRVATAGVLVVRQSPPTAKGHVFLTLEDEHGLIDVILRSRVAERVRAILEGSAVLRVIGMLQRADGVQSILAWHVEPLWIPGSATQPD